MKVRLLRSAFDDLAAGRDFYDRQQEGVGDYFFDSLFSEIDSLALHAGIRRTVFGFQRLLAKRFPYAIYYRLIEGEAVVFRVLD
jgi:plasmid stabilization system protein ParE